MLRLILPLLISLSLFGQSIAISDLAFIVQKKDKVTIVFANDVSKTMIVDFPLDYSKPLFMPYFKSVLSANNLKLRDDGGIFIVSNNVETSGDVGGLFGSSSAPLLAPPPLVRGGTLLNNTSLENMPIPEQIDFNTSFVSYKLKFLQIDDVKPLLDFSSLPYSFSLVSKTITFKENKHNKKYIPKLIEEIKSIDIKKDQVTLKITMYQTNQDKLREVGINPSLTFDFSLLSNNASLLTGDYVSSFKGSLKFLSNSGVSDVMESSSYLISDNETLDFQKVVSVPILDENFALTTDNGTNQSKKYKYQDVGFKLLTIPTIVGDTVYLDFNLTTGDVLTGGDLPDIQKNSISNKFYVKKGDVIILSGLTKASKIEDKKSIPFIDFIPYLGDIFTHKTNTVSNSTFNISIEILK